MPHRLHIVHCALLFGLLTVLLYQYYNSGVNSCTLHVLAGQSVQLPLVKRDEKYQWIRPLLGLSRSTATIHFSGHIVYRVPPYEDVQLIFIILGLVWSF